MAKGMVVESVKDALAVSSNIIESAHKEITWLVSAAMLVLAAQYSLHEKSRIFVQNGGLVRGIFDISYPYVDLSRTLLDIGEDVRHVGRYDGVFFLVGDRSESISAIRVTNEKLSLDDQLVAYWIKDPSYADYLLTSFEMAWAQSVAAEARIQELLNEKASKGER